MYRLAKFTQSKKAGRFITVHAEVLDQTLTLKLSEGAQKFLSDVYKTSDKSNVKALLQDSLTVNLMLLYVESTGRIFIPPEFSPYMKRQAESVLKEILLQKREEKMKKIS